MHCEKCQVNQATIHVNVQYNQKKQELNLCTSCYKKLEQKLHAPHIPLTEMFHNHFPGGGMTPPGTNQKSQPNVQEGILEQLGRNVTQAAKAGIIDPVIGRDQEVDRVIEILNRRNKNNPVLIGEPGVGKTAIAEGLAQKIIEKTVPNKLLNKEVIVLDVASLVADTGVRGQFEERMKQMIAELQQRKNVILFIDEIHQLVGAGSAQGSMDAGNILKPALARGELQVIGATTLKEYRDIEKDAALERRFQPVLVNEPSVEETIEILKGLRSKYEEFHGVTFSDETLSACAQLSHRYIQDRFLPDKAIDLMDEAGSRINLTKGNTDKTSIQKRLDELHMEKETATKAENYELAAKLRDEEKALEEQLIHANEAKKPAVTITDIQFVIEKKTGIPVGKLQQEEQAKMKDLATRLSQKVIGQEEAVQKVSKAIRRSRAGLKSKTRPIGSFLFVGPTGVGKTELSKALAEELFGTEDAMVRLDMSEYMEKHAISKLIGSPPGYVGHDEAGQLTEKVRRKPYSIILLDEIEKAHPDVQHMFLQILEDGRLTDSQGRTVSFKDTVIIMTSNAGAQDLKKKSLGFNTAQQFEEDTNILDSLGSYFKPEFLNRFDGIVQFKSLTEAQLIKIVDLMLAELEESLLEQQLSLQITEAAKQKLVSLGYHPAFGARPLRRAIQEQLEDQIADVLLEQQAITTLIADVTDNKITITAKP